MRLATAKLTHDAERGDCGDMAKHIRTNEGRNNSQTHAHNSQRQLLSTFEITCANRQAVDFAPQLSVHICQATILVQTSSMQ